VLQWANLLASFVLTCVVAVCCSVLQCVAVGKLVGFVCFNLRSCSVLQCVAVCVSVVCLDPPCVLQCVAVCCSVLQCVAVCCSVLQCVLALFVFIYLVFCSVLQ